MEDGAVIPAEPRPFMVQQQWQVCSMRASLCFTTAMNPRRPWWWRMFILWAGYWLAQPSGWSLGEGPLLVGFFRVLCHQWRVSTVSGLSDDAHPVL